MPSSYNLNNMSLRKVNNLPNCAVKVLFLGYNEEQTKLIRALIENNCEVWHCDGKLEKFPDFDIIISYGYRHIIKKSAIRSSPAPIINLHISYLPYNKGAHPNFWSFYDCTPSGVTIHLIDEGIDTGPILFQRYVNFGPDEITFSQTYRRLIIEIESLFSENLQAIISKNYKPIPQRRKGTYHRVDELPKEFRGWDSVITEEITRLDKILLNSEIN